MRRELQRYLDERPEEKLFVRLHPEWYKRLSRAPEDVSRIKPAADNFFGRTFGQRIDRLNDKAGMLSLMLSLVQAISDGRGKSGNHRETEKDTD
ncbi:hypothetical protein EWH99_01020 [Sporolactobacillus sp. THM7-7]|nr:hypothetical protein EWH99_01020 [Sporolactobacillus sp. THM7-7]